MNRKQLVDDIVGRTDLNASQVDQALTGLADSVTKAVVGGDKVVVAGFISFERVTRQARTGRNPQTGASMEIPAQAAVKVSAGKKLKDAVRGN